MQNETHQRPKVRVGRKSRPVEGATFHRRTLDAPGLATTGLIDTMLISQCSLWQPQLVVEHIENTINDPDRLLHERSDSRRHAGVDRSRILSVDFAWPSQGVVLGHVEELNHVSVTSFIGDECTRKFVSVILLSVREMRSEIIYHDGSPERLTVVALLELHLLFEREVHGLRAHVEHALNFCIGIMAFQAGGQPGQRGAGCAR